MKKLLMTTLISTLLLTACSQQESVGKVDGKEISKQSFESYLKHKNIPSSDAERAGRALNAYLERTALAAAIQKTEKLDGSLIAAEVEEFRKQVLLNRYFEMFLQDAISDDAVRNYYSNNIEKYQNAKVQVAHILLRVKPTTDESTRKAILTTAHEAYSKLQAGESFAEIARQYSEDKVSAAKGGSLGWINEGAVAPEFSEKAFAMQPDTISEPFLTSFGFHILKVLDGPRVVKKPLEAVKGDIRYQLRSQAKRAETERLLKSVKISQGR